MIPNLTENVNTNRRFARPRGMTAAQIEAKYPLYSSEYTELWVCSRKSDLIDYLLDRKIYPQSCMIEGNQHVAIFFLDKYFETRKAVELYNDLIARFMMAVPFDFWINFKSFKRQEKKPVQVSQAWQYQNLPSLQYIPKAPKFNDDHHFHDKTFWALKYYFEELIKQKRHTYFELEKYAITNFKDKCKDFSTLKCKCRNIYYWYCDRGFRLSDYERKCTDDELKSIRSVNAYGTNVVRKNKTNEKLSVIFKSPEKYKKKDGTWNISKIAEKTGLKRDTVAKKIREVMI